MDYEKQREILAAIKEDDVKKYAALADGKTGTLKMGRFPLLSIMYLYDAKKLAALYEEDYVEKNGWEELPELPELSSAFAKVAKKALRLYSTEAVSPLEMLLLLGRAGKARRLYPLTHLTAAQKSRMTSLYSIRYSLPLAFTEKGMEMPSPPLTKKAKQKIFLSAVSVFLAVAVLVGTPFVVNVFVPFIGVSGQYSESEQTPDADGFIHVDKFSDINLASTSAYKLTKDVAVPSGTFAETVNCTLDGDGKKITVNGGSTLFGTVNGTIKNVDFVFPGEWEVSDDFSFIAEINRGVIQNVSLSVSGTLHVTDNSEKTELFLSGIAINNTSVSSSTGYIIGCTADYDLHIVGERAANASFAGICSKNSYSVQECVVNGSITTDTCDVAGICAENDNLLYKNINRATITQTTSDQQWSPLCAGVVLKNVANYYGNVNVRVLECENHGVVTSASTFRSEGEFEENHSFGVAECGGIVGSNEGASVLNCLNVGSVFAESVECVTYAGGICGQCSSTSGFMGTSTPTVSGCQNEGAVSATVERIYGFAGGIAGWAPNGSFSSCVNATSAEVTLKVTGCTVENVFASIGGIVANGNGSALSNCENGGLVTAEVEISSVFVGGLAGIASSVSSSKNTGRLTVDGGETAYVGGLLGRANGAMNGCLSSERIEVTTEGDVYVGGLAAYAVFPLNESYCKECVVTVTGEKIYAGGAVGACQLDEATYYGRTTVYPGEVDSVVADASITVHGTESYVGGLVGYVYHKVYNQGAENEVAFGGSVRDSYFTGIIASTGSAKIGGIVGGTEKRLVSDPEDVHFSGNAFIKTNDRTAIGEYKDGENTLAGDNFGAETYDTKEDLSSLEKYAQIIAIFSE